MLLAEALSAANQRWIEQTERAIIADIADRHALPGLPAGRDNPVAFTPIVNRFGQFFHREHFVHTGNMTVYSVTVKKKTALQTRSPTSAFPRALGVYAPHSRQRS